MPAEDKKSDPQVVYTDLTKTKQQSTEQDKPGETGGPKGLEPTRYGDWEKAGRCIDF